jgi:hypothetical protein
MNVPVAQFTAHARKQTGSHQKENVPLLEKLTATRNSDIDYSKILEMMQNELHSRNIGNQDILEGLRHEYEKRFSELETRIEKQLKLSLHQTMQSP